MKRIFAVVLSAMLVLSLAACTDSTESSSQTSSGSSSVAEQSSEPDISGLTVKEDVSNLDTNSEAEPEQSESSQSEQNSSSQASSQKPEQNSSQASSQKPEQNSSQSASQPPVEKKPTETSKPEKKEDVSKLDTKLEPKPESKPVKPVEQPIQPSTPAAPETDDTGWTQAKVDAVVEAYRSAALERGWTEDTSLNIALTTGGAWGNPFNTNCTDYNVLTDPANIEEYLYGYEFDRNAKPEDMYFHVVVEKHSDYWEIYFIFA